MGHKNFLCSQQEPQKNFVLSPWTTNFFSVFIWPQNIFFLPCKKKKSQNITLSCGNILWANEQMITYTTMKYYIIHLTRCYIGVPLWNLAYRKRSEKTGAGGCSHNHKSPIIFPWSGVLRFHAPICSIVPYHYLMLSTYLQSYLVDVYMKWNFTGNRVVL